MEWLTENKIPLGRWMRAGVDWLTDNAAGFFDAVSLGLGVLLEGIVWLL